MQIITEIRIGRLFLALGITLLIVDTVPHPHLSAGFIEQSRQRMQAEFMRERSTEDAIAELNR